MLPYLEKGTLQISLKDLQKGRLSQIIQLSKYMHERQGRFDRQKRWRQCDHGGRGDLIDRRDGGNVTMEAGTRGCSQKPRNAGSQTKMEMTRNCFSPRTSKEQWPHR